MVVTFKARRVRNGSTGKRIAIIALAWFCGAAAAQAQSYPSRPITLTVTAAAGGEPAGRHRE